MQQLYVDKFNQTVLTMYPQRSNLIDLVSQVMETILRNKFILNRGFTVREEEITGEFLLTNYIEEFKVTAGHPKNDYGQTVTIRFRLDGRRSPSDQFTMNS